MSEELKTHPYAKTIWDLLMTEFNNEIGVAGLMGNLWAESGLYPDRVQGDVPYSDYSKRYTAKVDNGAISARDFIHSGPNGGGYGLAQWTYYTRKQNLYNKWVNSSYSSIGDVKLACAFLIEELRTSYVAVYNAIKTAPTIRSASDIVLHKFESPADQSERVEKLRALLGEEIYNTFSGSPVGDHTGGGTSTKRRRLSKLLLFAIATDI